MVDRYLRRMGDKTIPDEAPPCLESFFPHESENKLYVKRLKGGHTEDKCEQYRIYRNKSNHIMRTAERKHYLDLLNEHKSNLNKSWQILKMVINKRKCTPVCTKFQTNGKVVSDGHEISNKFNTFFVNFSQCYSPNKQESITVHDK